MTMAQLLHTLGPAERAAVQAVYVDRLPLAAAAAHLSIDQAALGATLAAAFRAVAQWVGNADDAGVTTATIALHPDTSPASDVGSHTLVVADGGERVAD